MRALRVWLAGDGRVRIYDALSNQVAAVAKPESRPEGCIHPN